VTRSDRLLLATLRRSVASRLLAGDDPARVRAELMDRVGRSFGKAYAGPDLAPLLPGKLELPGARSTPCCRRRRRGGTDTPGSGTAAGRPGDRRPLSRHPAGAGTMAGA